jgi:D-alanyl-D-alanine carboxypeptidase/D-alanyl-D-alanine-endopeptidase (penicillin-binding protein 4)
MKTATRPLKSIAKPALLLSLSFAAPALAAPAPKSLPPATQKRIEELLRNPALQSAHIGLAVVALGKAQPGQFPAAGYDGGAQPLLFARDEKKRFLPASNFKLFTAAWVLNQLGPTKTFTTRAILTKVMAMRVGSWPTGTPYPSVLTLYGDGDPSLTTADLDALAKTVVADNPGALIVRSSSTLFPKGIMGGEDGGGRYPDGWTIDDALWYYGAPVSALALNRNQVDVTITGGAKVGDIATVKTNPEAPFSIFAPVMTVEKGSSKIGLTWTRGDATSPLGSTLTIEGSLAPGQVVTEGVAVPDPHSWAQDVFAAALRANKASVVEPDGFYGQQDAAIAATHESKPLSVLLSRFLKNSDNLYGEMLLRRAAVQLPPLANEDPQIASSGMAARAHNAMLTWLKKSGVPTAGLRFSDGSGLSRYNLVTPISLVRLLGAVQKIEGGKALFDALPVAGVDGTLKNQMKGTAAQNNVRAKTGTFSIANSLSGYVTTKDGNRLAVSILTNGVEDGDLARRWQGQVFTALAEASWAQAPVKASSGKPAPR